MPNKYVYFFSKESTDGKKEFKDLLGGKGANLAEMCLLGLPIPPGFTITTEACLYYLENNKKYPKGFKEEVEENLKKLELLMNKKLGNKDNPLLLSIRSGAAVSMPGMMDTILNLGLTDISIKGLAKQFNNERFAFDSYRRFIQMFGDVVLGIEHDQFEYIFETRKNRKQVNDDVELNAEDLKTIVSEFKSIIKKGTGEDFPNDPKIQLWKSINAVFESWNNERAITYRKVNNITGLLGTAVNVQAMVFGNLGETSGSGVSFSRNPATGENEFYGEYLMNAQGEDIVAGIRTPLPISRLKEQNSKLYDQLIYYKDLLEKHFKEMQDMEFTIENETLYLLQTRKGKRTPNAEIKIAVDMVNEGLISKKEAIMRVEPDQIDKLIHPNIDPAETYKIIARGLPASPGAASGKIVFDADNAEKMVKKGDKVILVRKETSPEDIGGMNISEGILTSTGGMTSHAAVVARSMGKSCIVGCKDLIIKSDNSCILSDKVFKEGDVITLNGTKGEVIDGQVNLITPEISGSFKDFLKWVDEERTINIRTNADTPKDSKIARKFGAEGIGLCRTEHMFFEGSRIDAVREMILAKNEQGRKKALRKILPMQMNDFIAIFEVMDGYPVTIRLLDPPLHEFLPKTNEELQKLSKSIGIDLNTLKNETEELKEFNPMLGHRGCRLAITYPEIAEMQCEAIIRAALTVKRKGITVQPEIMIPLTGTEKEFEFLKSVIDKKAKEVFNKENDSIEYKLGTMIEIPRACLVADKIAQSADFFSFGTNDLTQMIFGYSRDDTGLFLSHYLEKGILPSDPFQILDREGVGKLIKEGIKNGRKPKPDLKIGICGEHGGEPTSIEFCYNAGMNYVSCSPFRVPIAKLAAAQAKIKNEST